MQAPWASPEALCIASDRTFASRNPRATLVHIRALELKMTRSFGQRTHDPGTRGTTARVGSAISLLRASTSERRRNAGPLGNPQSDFRSLWLACVRVPHTIWLDCRALTDRPSSPPHHALRATGTGSWCDTVRARKLGSDAVWLAACGTSVPPGLRPVVCGPQFG